MNIFELFGKVALDGSTKVKEELTGLEKKTHDVQKGLRVMGTAATAFGVAGLAIISSTKEINAQLGVTAINLGLTAGEMRDLTLAVTNVTFPIDEVTKTFDLLARAGIENTEVLKTTATAFDTLGDATGNTASITAGIMIDAMKTFGLSADEIADKSDMMTYMVRNSTVNLEDFNTMVGYTSQDMVAAGLTIDDMAAAMMYMSDNGVAPGKVMLREWNTAVTKSQEEGIALTEALGMTSDELEIYKGNLEGATGLTQEYADAANEQFTIMDKMKQKWSELTLSASGFLEPLEPVLAGMTALGPLMIGLSTSAGTAAVKWGLATAASIAHNIALGAKAVALGVVTVAQWLWNAAMSANPIGLIIIAIGLLITGIILLVQKWDWVTEKAGELWDKMKEVWENITGFIKEAWEKIVGFVQEHWDMILAILFPAVGLPLLIAENWGAISEVVEEILSKVTEVFSGMWEAAFEWGQNLVKGLWEGISSLAEWIKDKISGWASGLWDSVTEFFEFGSPSKLAMRAGENIALGLGEGIEGGVQDILGGVRNSLGDIQSEISLRPAVAQASPAAGDSYVYNVSFPGAVVREDMDITKISQQVAREINRLKLLRGNVG